MDEDFEFDEFDEKTLEEINTAIYSLVTLNSKMYDLYFYEMYNLEKEGKKNTKEFKNCLDRLYILKEKEKRIYEKITNYDIIDIDTYTEDFIDQITDLPEKKDLLATRIFTTFEYMDLTTNDMYEQSERTIAQRSYKIIEDLELQYMNYNYKDYNDKNKFLFDKYCLSFTSSHLEDDFIMSGFDPENILVFSDETNASDLKLDMTKYKQTADKIKHNYVFGIINTLIEKVHDDDIKYVQDMFKRVEFFSKGLTTKDLISLKNYCNDIDNLVGQKLNGIFNEILENRTDVEDESLNSWINEKAENDITTKLSPEVTDNMFELIKCSNKIIKNFTKLNFEDKENIENYKKLLEQEYTLFDKINQENSSELIDLLEHSIDIIIGSDNEYQISLIKDRLYSFFDEPKNEMYISSDVPYYIMQNQMVKSIKELEKIIKTKEGLEREDLEYVRDELIITDRDLTSSYINALGIIDDITILDNETIADLLNISINEYEFDKNDILLEEAKKIIIDIVNLPKDKLDEFDIADRIYEETYLKVAANEMDSETLNKLKVFYESETKNNFLNLLKELEVEKYSQEFFNNAYRLIKQAENNVLNYCDLDFNNDKQVSEFKKSLDEEQRLFDHAYQESPEILKILINSYGTEPNNIQTTYFYNLVKSRLNAYLIKMQTTPAISPAEANILWTNQTIKVLEELESVRNNNDTLKDIATSTITKLLVINPELMRKYVEVCSDINKLNVIDDQTAADILGITLKQFKENRDDIFYNQCEQIIDKTLNTNIISLNPYQLVDMQYNQAYLKAAIRDMDKEKIDNLNKTYEKKLNKKRH